jgi:hypothetical protein
MGQSYTSTHTVGNVTSEDKAILKAEFSECETLDMMLRGLLRKSDMNFQNHDLI